ncbi:DUF6653 family protein [Flagellimonas algicola]|uniref:Uncharacterized protein n=1 Tax=Flagellimonas algicola TaxID=2583815 RepID=A0ABY2WG82_9FLAO|nr:DUF6653 family protein [Allomuricauda algicola]TMU50393.1 hypothetical protein FGG15_19795 [Allomuricauda algicola]
MTTERKISRFFNLTDSNWMKHANPWSVGTRYTVLPLIIIAFWSRIWLGWWFLIPAALSISWIFLNPVMFCKPKSTKNWASKAVMGERVYLNRDKVKIPPVHKTVLLPLLNIISSIGMGIAIWAIVEYSIWGAVIGTVLAYLGKSWYLDRMVWLYEDMKENHQEYLDWEY